MQEKACSKGSGSKVNVIIIYSQREGHRSDSCISKSLPSFFFVSSLDTRPTRLEKEIQSQRQI